MIASLVLAQTLTLPATFVRSYDGDTITVSLVGDFPEVVAKDMPVRIKGIDTPELNAKTDCERVAARKAADVMLSMFTPGESVTLLSCERDKYFRLLCDVRNSKGLDVANMLILSGLAVPYFGGTKRPFVCLKE